MKRYGRSSYRSYHSDEEITKGEIITVIVAFFICTVICIAINFKITNSTSKRNEKYYKAIQIDNDERMFKYAMSADEGNALIHGSIKAIDTVSLPEIVGEYMAIEVAVERYNLHSEEVEDKDKDGKVIGSHTEEWYQWDYETSHVYHSENVNFLGVDFPYTKFKVNNYKTLDLSKNISSELSSKVHLNMLYEGSFFLEQEGDLRYTFYIVPVEEQITAFANLRENNMYNVNSHKRQNVDVYYKNIPEVIDGMEKSKKVPNIVFTIIWYIAFVGGACYFVMQRNRWADF